MYKCQNMVHILRAEITRILVKITENDLTIFDQQFIKIKFVIGEVSINETILQQQNCNKFNANSLVETLNSRHPRRNVFLLV
jgi:CRISPR/Cas system-associated protein endoribonuclease Cas2